MKAHKIPLAKKKAAKNFTPLVDEYTAGLTGWQRDVAAELRKVIKSASNDLKEEVKWGFPCYTFQGQCVCGLMSLKDTVNFVLYQGAHLDDPDGLIEGTGKSMRHVKLRSLKDIRKRPFTKFIRDTIRLLKEERRSQAPKQRRTAVLPAGSPLSAFRRVPRRIR